MSVCAMNFRIVAVLLALIIVGTLQAETQISKQIMTVVRSKTGLDLEAFGRRRHGRALEIVSHQENLDRIQRVRHPPVGRIHFRDGRRRPGVNR